MDAPVGEVVDLAPAGEGDALDHIESSPGSAWLDVPPAQAIAELEAEAQAAADADPVARHDLAYLTTDLVAGAALTRANLAAQEAEATRPLTPNELEELAIIDPSAWRAYLEAQKVKLGLPTLAATLDVVQPLRERQTGRGTPTAPEVLPEPASPYPVSIAQMTRPPHLDDWVIEGAMRLGSFWVLGATEGAGKSYIRDEIAMRCALGSGALFGHYPVVRRVRVLLLDEDNGPEEEWRRNEAMFAHVGTDRAAMTDYFRVSLAGVLLDDVTWQARVRAWIAELSIGLLILDPISMMYRAKELREELLPVANYLRSLQRDRPELVIVLVHHLRKPVSGQKPTDKALSDLRGALWGQVADVVALVTPLGERRVKWALHKRIQPSEAILEQTQAGPFTYVGDVGGDARRVSNDDRVLACVDAGGTSVNEVLLATGIAERTAWAAIRRLRAAGILSPGGALKRTSEAAE
jgi:hypothetical protein